MKKRLMMVMSLGFVIVAAAAVDAAAEGGGRHDRRQHRQRARIHEGVKSGDVTRQEAKKLRMEQRHIRRAERRAESDGEVTQREKLRLERMQDKASKDIHELKSNEAKKAATKAE